MNAPEARVVAAGSDFATVSVEAVAACARCAAGRGCGAGLLQQGRTRLIEVSVAAGLDLEPGDRVRLELAPERILRAAWLAYGLPLLAMVLGVAFAAGMAQPVNDFVAVVAGAGGLAGGVVLGRGLLRKHACLRTIRPVVLAKMNVGADHDSCSGN
jgi:sigma-E factor negative regulatory protein RseC